MKRFIVKQTGREVDLGDTLTIKSNKKNEFYDYSNTITFVITEPTLPILLKEGIVEKKPLKCEKETPVLLDFYIEKIARKMKWTKEETILYFQNTYKIFPAAVFSIFLKEIAIELDKKYENHIKYSDEIYVISLTNGEISKINKEHIKNYKNFAAFRSKKDAFLAYNILYTFAKELFNIDGIQ